VEGGGVKRGFQRGQLEVKWKFKEGGKLGGG